MQQGLPQVADLSQLYCGIARTEEGYAVDVFCGDTCVDSLVYATRADARRATETLKTLYRTDRRKPTAVAHMSSHRSAL